MKYWIPANLLIALWAGVLAVFLTPEIPNDHGFAHAKFSAMDQGGDGSSRHEPLLIYGGLCGSAMIGIFVSLLAWGSGASSHRVARPYLRWAAFFIGWLLYESVFVMMCFAYRQSLAEPEVTFFGPFPAAVSWFLFGLWPIPAFFIVLYVAFFNRWIFPPEAAKTFEQLVESRADKNGN
jgi:hypothetical protein